MGKLDIELSVTIRDADPESVAGIGDLLQKIAGGHVRARVVNPCTELASVKAELQRALGSAEEVKATTEATLNACKWDTRLAAQALGISRPALYDRMRKFGLRTAAQALRAAQREEEG